MSVRRWPTPGVYEDRVAAPTPPPVVRDDIAGFVGLTERGPVDWALRIESWEEFRSHFGDRSDSFVLPDAVLGFFLNGGQICYVVRVLHRPSAAAASLPCQALGILGSPSLARWVASEGGLDDPGLWGNGVAVSVHFTVRVLDPQPAQPDPGDTKGLLLSADGSSGRSELSPGDLLWVGNKSPPVFAVVDSVGPTDPTTTPLDGLAADLEVRLVQPLGVLAAGAILAVIEATVDVLTNDGQREHFEGLGLSDRHPQFLAPVLDASSRLVALRDPSGAPFDANAGTTLVPNGLFLASGAPPPKDDLAIAGLTGGADGLADVVRDDFFTPLGLVDDEQPENNRGLEQLDRFDDVSLVVMPDLVVPGEPPPPTPPPRPPALNKKRHRFSCPAVATGPFVPPAPPSGPAEYPVNLIDPLVADGRATLTQQQRRADLAAAEARLVAYTSAAGDRIALLAPPPSADPRTALLWRARFDTPFAAAYYPWLQFGDPIEHPPVSVVPPTGVAAGMIALCEHRAGVGRAPANLPAAGVAGLDRVVTRDEWGQLHDANFDVFRQQPDQVRLLGARTLSVSDASYLYLHTRRLITHLKRALERRMQWVVFEAHTPLLWSRVIRDVNDHVLRPLYDRRAFAGATPADSYYIRCDATLNPRAQQAVGQLVCEIGVAPNVPCEYIVFRLAASRDTGLTLEEQG